MESNFSFATFGTWRGTSITTAFPLVHFPVIFLCLNPATNTPFRTRILGFLKTLGSKRKLVRVFLVIGVCRGAPGPVRQSKWRGVYAEPPRGPLGAEASPDPPRVTIRHLAPWLSFVNCRLLRLPPGPLELQITKVAPWPRHPPPWLSFVKGARAGSSIKVARCLCRTSPRSPRRRSVAGSATRDHPSPRALAKFCELQITKVAPWPP